MKFGSKAFVMWVDWSCHVEVILLSIHVVCGQRVSNQLNVSVKGKQRKFESNLTIFQLKSRAWKLKWKLKKEKLKKVEARKLKALKIEKRKLKRRNSQALISRSKSGLGSLRESSRKLRHGSSKALKIEKRKLKRQNSQALIFQLQVRGWKSKPKLS